MGVMDIDCNILFESKTLPSAAMIRDLLPGIYGGDEKYKFNVAVVAPADCDFLVRELTLQNVDFLEELEKFGKNLATGTKNLANNFAKNLLSEAADVLFGQKKNR